jgi:hypothetical protein
LHANGYEWYHGQRYIDDNRFRKCRQDTVYFFNEGLYGHLQQDVNGYTVLEWSQFASGEFGIDDLKTGMLVEFRDGSFAMVMANMYDDLIFTDGKDSCKVKDVYNQDLSTMSRIKNDFDVMRVWDRPCFIEYVLSLSTDYRDCIFNRDKMIYLSINEIAEKFGIAPELIRITGIRNND